MTERAQPGAQRSIAHNIEIGEALGNLSDGWIVPSDETTLSAQRSDLDETAFTEFNSTYSATSFDVDIGAGEGYVDGWVAKDVPTTVTLEPNTAGQIVVLGWNVDATYDSSIHAKRDGADEIYVALESDVPQNDPHTPIWEFDTDGSGVINATDHRTVGLTVGEIHGNELHEQSVTREIREADGETLSLEVRSNDPSSPENGDIWLRSDL